MDFFAFLPNDCNEATETAKCCQRNLKKLQTNIQTLQIFAWMWMTMHSELGRLLSYYILIIYFLIVFHYHLELFCYHPITAQTPISQMSHLNLPLPSSFLPFLLLPLLLWQLKLQYPKYPISISPFLPPSFPSSLPLLLWQLKPQCPKHGGDSKVICFQGAWECLEWSRQSPGPSWKLFMVPGIHHSRYFFWDFATSVTKCKILD